MKYINLILFFLVSGCGLHVPFFKKSPGNEDLPPPPPQPAIVDPIDLIIEGDNTEVLSEQSHFNPFFTIITVVLIMCLAPMLYVKSRPYVIQLKDWSGEKLIITKEWIKKKLKERKEKKLDPEEK